MPNAIAPRQLTDSLHRYGPLLAVESGVTTLIDRDLNDKALAHAAHVVKAALTVIKVEVQLAARAQRAEHSLSNLVSQQVERAQAALDEFVRIETGHLSA